MSAAAATALRWDNPTWRVEAAIERVAETPEAIESYAESGVPAHLLIALLTTPYADPTAVIAAVHAIADDVERYVEREMTDTVERYLTPEE